MTQIAELPRDDARKVQERIKEIWGFDASLEYCEALIRFIEEMTKGRDENQSH